MSSTDLQAHARIREAAVSLFGQRGFRATTVRQIAEAAGVSPGLVIHHFGSKDGLHRACDEWMIGQLTTLKTSAIAGDAASAMGSAQAQLAPFIGYFAASIAEGGDAAGRMFEAMCEVTRQIYAVGIPAGVMRDPQDLEATASLLVAHSLGISILEKHIAHLLGGEELTDPPVMMRYATAAAEVYTHGVFADDSMLQQLRAAAPQSPPGDGVTDPDPPSNP